MARMQLGQVLLKEGLITEEQLCECLSEQKQAPDLFLGHILEKKGYVSEQTLVQFLGKQLGYKVIINLENLLRRVDRLFLESSIFSEEFIRQNSVLPLDKEQGVINVALVDPLDLMLLDNIRAGTQLNVNPILIGQSLLNQALEQLFSNKINNNDIDNNNQDELEIDKMVEEAEEIKIVRFVNLVIIQAITENASDIHLEPLSPKEVQIRYRIDGRLIKSSSPPAKIYPAIVSRIKIMASLDIAERRLPQDGAFSMMVENRNIDIRVSFVPSIFGEIVVLRILDKVNLPLQLDKIGLSPKNLSKFQQALKQPHGMILLTGPTGSGKTTTLYAALNSINNPHKNLNTVEDPVEYRLDGINQIQTKADIGLNFAKVLRALLRQDPDVIMVGEIRDKETADICIQAALTGHFVMSTLHTNSALQTIDRLLDIGIEPSLIASSIIMIVAQRLVRRLCEHCKEAHDIEPQVKEKFNLQNTTLYKGTGCSQCRETGFLGRVAVHEVIMFDYELKKSIISQELGLAREHLNKSDFESLFKNGLELVKQGVTSFDELIGTVGEDIF